jgi:hypothetical protein
MQLKSNGGIFRVKVQIDSSTKACGPDQNGVSESRINQCAVSRATQFKNSSQDED